MNNRDLIWLAGWLEGEGSFIIWKNLPIISAVTTDFDIVEKVSFLFDRKWGKAGPPKKKHHKQVYFIRIKGKDSIELMKKLYPLMGIRRKQQIDKVLNKYKPIYYRIKETQLKEILKHLMGGKTHKQIAEMYGVHRTTISHIANGKIPKWLQ